MKQTIDGDDWPRLRDNQGELAAWMPQLVDGSPDKLAVIEIPHGMVPTDAAADESERVFSREFDRAKRDRPNLSVAIGPANADFPNAALLFSVHEHKWVGGECVRGCGTAPPRD